MQKMATKRNVLTFLAVIGLLIFLHFSGILRPVEAFATKVFNPVLVKFYSVSSSIRIYFQEKPEKDRLLKIIEDLESQVSRLSAENAKLRVF